MQSHIKKTTSDSLLFKVVIFSAAATMALGNVAISPVVPAIEKHFAHVEQIAFLAKFILTLPALFTVLFSSLVGFMMDKFGRLKLVFAGMLIWSISGTAGFFLTDSLYWLLVSRAFLGIGTAALIVGIPVLIGDYYAGAKKDKALGLMGFSQTFGGAVFMVLSGFLGVFGWQYSFLVYLLEAVVLVMAIFVLFEPKRTTNSVLKKENAREKFRVANFMFSYAMGFFVCITFFVAPVQMPYLISEVLHKDSDVIGLMIAVMILIAAFSPLFYAKMKLRLTVFKIFFICFVGMGLGFILVGTMQMVWSFLLGGMLSGAFFSIAMINNMSYLFSLARDFEKASAYGILGMCMSLGQFLSPLFSESVVKHIGRGNMFWIYGILLCCVGLVFWFFKNKVRLTQISRRITEK